MIEKMQQTDKIASKYLGKRIDGFVEYNPEVLVAIPREENRIQYGIEKDNLPFVGWDIWHSYEFSVLTKNGVPVTRILKLKYCADSDYIVESKSLKLYLNSFNMTKIGENIIDCLEKCKTIIEKDLSEKLKTEVIVNFFDNEAKKLEVFSKYKDVFSMVNEKDIMIENFKESCELLKILKIEDEKKEHFIKFDSLRSNCRVTHQPDFGDCFIYYKSQKVIDEKSLIEYLISFRCEYHFHEECCEMIFKRLSDILDKEDELFVGTLYTRRGGIDISPIRYSKSLRLDDVEKIIDIKNFTRYGIKQ